ncbi:MAG TPA: 2-enoyl thioester reductase domain-containing protein [Verrucomicrobiae bacterium]|nr:2-enoyl thioester reductase domain-containing protein [Verrucomicrobiae bacterium]
MKHSATIACLHEFGEPEKVIRLEERELPKLEPHQVLVEVSAAPINPADLNLISGTYGIRPNFPVVVGNEGAGVIAGAGGAVTGLSVGQRVIAPVRLGWWCTARVLEAAQVFAVPSGLPRDMATMLTINPATAYRMLVDFVKLQPGDWIIQNAANSAVGRFVIQIAKHKGWRTVNVVRRRELIEELRGKGADVAVTDETPLSRQISELTGGAEARLGLNAVGGESAREIAKSLGPHGTLVTYGAMARQPLHIANGLLIFRDIRVRGFWVSEWFRQSTRVQIEKMFAEIFPLVQAGKLQAPIEKIYPLARVREAVAHAGRSGRRGKILLEM